MSRARYPIVAIIGVFVPLLALATAARAHEGHTSWGPWRFDWAVYQSAGISIRNVYYNNELVFWILMPADW